MRPIEFEECNVIFGASQPEFQALPAFKDNSHPQGTTVVHCWKLSPEEIAKISVTGELWVSVLTFGNPLQPIYLTINKEDVIRHE